jgi:phosphoribosylaminoimidazole (AIR) synthetase
MVAVVSAAEAANVQGILRQAGEAVVELGVIKARADGEAQVRPLGHLNLA